MISGGAGLRFPPLQLDAPSTDAADERLDGIMADASVCVASTEMAHFFGATGYKTNWIQKDIKID